MAEGYLKSKNLPSLQVLSRGIFADGSEVSPNAVKVMRETGTDISSHISSPLKSADLDADMFICMAPSHKEVLEGTGIANDKIIVLGGGIPDPFGGDINIYRACRNEISAAIDGILNDGKFLPITIKKTSHEDISEIAELEKTVFSSPWSINAITESIAAGTHFFTARFDGDFAGYVGISTVADEGYIANIAVKPQFRGKGVGTMLIDRCIQLGFTLGLRFISLEVRTSNREAVTLYKKLGFRNSGLRKNFYTNPREDAVIMTRRLITDENTCC